MLHSWRVGRPVIQPPARDALSGNDWLGYGHGTKTGAAACTLNENLKVRLERFPAHSRSQLNE